MSRRRNRSELTVIYWRDIPAQVTAQVGAERQQALLPDRFQHAIDRAAAVAGLTSTDDYVNEWRKVARPLTDEDPATQARALADKLDAECPRPILEALVANGGVNDTVANGGVTPETEPSPEQDPS